MEARLEIDTAAVEKAIEGLNTKQMVNAFRGGFRKTNKIVTRAVQQSFRAHYPGSVLYKGIHAKEFRTGEGAITDLMYIKRVKGAGNSRAKGASQESKYWVARILATGTGPRQAYIKMRTRHGCWGLNRGRMVGSGYFEEGVKASMKQAETDMQKNLEEAIIKQAKKAGLAAS